MRNEPLQDREYNDYERIQEQIRRANAERYVRAGEVLADGIIATMNAVQRVGRSIAARWDLAARRRVTTQS